MGVCACAQTGGRVVAAGNYEVALESLDEAVLGEHLRREGIHPAPRLLEACSQFNGLEYVMRDARSAMRGWACLSALTGMGPRSGARC
jgi:hypothetical protein